MVRHSADDGASAVLVAILLFVFVGVAALAVDLGSGYSTKRDLLVDTDAAALAAAAIAGQDGCTTDARDAAASYLSANLGTTVSGTELESLGGYTCAPLDKTVTVSFTENVQTVFAGVLNTTEMDVASSSTASFGAILPSGLRPVTVCMLDTEIADWATQGAGAQITLSHEKSWAGAGPHDPSPCIGAPGNWGFTCFDKDRGDDAVSGTVGCDGNNASNSIDAMLEHGYSGDVDLGLSTPLDEDCNPDDLLPDLCEQSPGSLGYSVAPGLSYLQSSQLVFPILGISAYSPGTGQNATTYPSAFLAVRLVSYQLTGNDKHFVLELVDYFEEGTASAAYSGNLARVAPPVLCGADAQVYCG